MSKRRDRHFAMRQIVREQNVRTQQELADALQGLGYECTQATISRDIVDVGLKKASDGTYVLQEDLILKKMISEMLINAEQIDKFLVIKVLPGTASGVAAAIDGADFEDIVGTVAGDDTIFVLCRGEEKASDLANLIVRMSGDK